MFKVSMLDSTLVSARRPGVGILGRNLLHMWNRITPSQNCNFGLRFGALAGEVKSSRHAEAFTLGQLSAIGSSSLSTISGKHINDKTLGICAKNRSGLRIQERWIHGLHSAEFDIVEERHLQQLSQQRILGEENNLSVTGPEAICKTQATGVDRVLEMEAVLPHGTLFFQGIKPTMVPEADGVSFDPVKFGHSSEDGKVDEIILSTNDLVSHSSQASEEIQSNMEENAVPNHRVQKHQDKESLGKVSDSVHGAESNSQYPIPLSPLSGEVARSIEYERALVAESAFKSGPAMTRSGVLFEDDWLLVLNKPCGIYSEHVLNTVPSLMTSSDCRAKGSYLSSLTLGISTQTNHTLCF